MLTKVYSIVRTLLDEQQQYEKFKKPTLSVPVVYDKIKRSNSSLNRKNKKILEDSIERVLDILKEESASNDDTESIEGDFDGIDNNGPTTQVCQLVTISVHSIRSGCSRMLSKGSSN